MNFTLFLNVAEKHNYDASIFLKKNFFLSMLIDFISFFLQKLNLEGQLLLNKKSRSFAPDGLGI